MDFFPVPSKGLFFQRSNLKLTSIDATEQQANELNNSNYKGYEPSLTLDPTEIGFAWLVTQPPSFFRLRCERVFQSGPAFESGPG